MPYTPDQIRQKAYELERVGAPSSDIEEFVKRATQEADIQPHVYNPIDVPDYKPGLASRLSQDFQQRGKKATESLNLQTQGKQGYGSTALQFLGQGAGFLGDVAGEAVSAITPQPIKQGLSSLFNKAIQTAPVQKATEAYSQFREQQPTNARNIESILNLGTAAIGGKAVASAGKALTKGGVKLADFFAKSSEKKAFQEAINIIKPELNKSGKIAALESGRGVKKGFFGTTEIKPSLRDEQVARTIQGIVKKGKDATENIGIIRNEIKKEAEITIQGLQHNDAIFNINQLSSKLNGIEKPPLLVADTTLNNAYSIAQNKFLEFVSKQPKNLSGLLKARKEFDVWIQRQFPKIFDDVRFSPLEKALKDIRMAANDFIAEKLPDGSPFKVSLQKQNLMYEAVSNIAEKSYKEVGTNIMDRLLNAAKRNPAITAGLGAYTGYQAAKRLLK